MRLLIQHRADVNLPASPQGWERLGGCTSGAISRFDRRSPTIWSKGLIEEAGAWTNVFFGGWGGHFTACRVRITAWFYIHDDNFLKIRIWDMGDFHVNVPYHAEVINWLNHIELIISETVFLRYMYSANMARATWFSCQCGSCFLGFGSCGGAC